MGIDDPQWLEICDAPFCLGDSEVDPSTGDVSNSQGQTRLAPLDLKTLLHLASNAGKVVPREELENVVWDGRIVGYDSLTSTMFRLRKALGDNPKQPQILETIPKKGYRLIASPEPVERAQTTLEIASQAAPLKRSYAVKPGTVLLIAMLLVASATSIVWWQLGNRLQDSFKSSESTLPSRGQTDKAKTKLAIAVLPFLNLSDDKEQDYFSDGMTEDLITDLSKISALRVISRSSTFFYKDKKVDVRAIAKRLGVSHIVEGSVRKVGPKVRITAQLVEGNTGTHVWAKRYDRDLKDIFALQDEVRGKIVASLAINILTEEMVRASRRGTKSIEAYDLYLRGRHQEGQFTRAGTAAAIEYYRRAISKDANFSDAYARLANMYDFYVRFGWSDNKDNDRSAAIEYARKALELDNLNPFAHWTQSRIISRHGRKDIDNQIKAISYLEQAIALEPNYADAYAFASVLYIGIGKVDKAVAAIGYAINLNPEYPFWYLMNRGIIYYMQAKYKDSVADLNMAVNRNPDAIFLRWWLAAAYAQAGIQDDAEWQVDEMKAKGLNARVENIIESTSIIRHPPYVARFSAGLRKAGIPP